MSEHVPVLLEQVIEHLSLQPGDDVIDCTFGGGGYTRAMLEATAPDGRVLALDRDPQALAAAKDFPWVQRVGDRLRLIQADFRNLAVIARTQEFVASRGIAVDLGMSSLQLVAPNRGFSFAQDAPLDMRFDPTSEQPTAADLLRTLSASELERIFRTYGEEPAARAIARAIVEERRRRSIMMSTALVAVIAGVVRRRKRIHPATRTFQALRIAVNDELGALEAGIPQMFDLLVPGGRLAIVSFHSLEDRIVKRWFRHFAAAGRGTLVVRRPLRPSMAEARQNPRSRSAKLRVIESIR